VHWFLVTCFAVTWATFGFMVGRYWSARQSYKRELPFSPKTPAAAAPKVKPPASWDYTVKPKE